MNEKLASERIGWLGTLLAAQRSNLEKILLRLKEIGCRAGTSLGLHRKFIQLMEQIAADREKEMDLLFEIEQVEKRHLAMKQARKLRCADDKPSLAPVMARQPEQPKPKKDGLLGLIALLAFFSPKPDKP